jgi:5'-nucleotidase
MSKPKILITNDDGIYSSGIRASYEALKDLGEVYVVAPAVQMSGVGRSMSIMEPIRVSHIVFNGMEGYAVDGTPTDSVVIGIFRVIGSLPDLVVSGINMGENVSTESVTTSGTVCAALEAATQGSPAIAISQQTSDFEKFEFVFKPANYSLAKKVLRMLAKKVLENGMPSGVDVLNVNVPAGVDKIEFEVTKLARNLYKTRIEERKDPRGRSYYWINGVEVGIAEAGTDIYALRRGKVSITPITVDMTALSKLETLEKWLSI